MIKVSVIVPVYNGEKNLTECMDSICGQTLHDIEIICIDDGSTDKSLEILRNYQNKDPRIQIYQQDHKYAGVARNLGKSHASGEYLAFWDCDDFFDLKALEKLYNRAKTLDADVCVCGGNRYIETKKKSYPFTGYLNMNRVPKEEVFNRFTNPDHYLDFTTAVAWNKLFKRKHIENLSLDFQTLRNANDVYFTMNALGLADRITTLNERLVTYRMNQGDSLTDSHDKDPLSPIQAWIDIAENLEKYDGFGERSFANRAIGNMIGLVSNLQEWNTFDQAIKVLQDYGLKKMHILPKEDGYYYNEWHKECVDHLYHDSSEEFSVFLARFRYIRQLDTSADLGDAREELSESNNQIKILKKENNDYKKENKHFEKENEKIREKIIRKDSRISELKSQKKKAEKENIKLTEEIDKIRNSWTFKTGKIITWIPGKIKKIFAGSSGS